MCISNLVPPFSRLSWNRWILYMAQLYNWLWWDIKQPVNTIPHTSFPHPDKMFNLQNKTMYIFTHFLDFEISGSTHAPMSRAINNVDEQDISHSFVKTHWQPLLMCKQILTAGQSSSQLCRAVLHTSPFLTSIQMLFFWKQWRHWW